MSHLRSRIPHHSSSALMNRKKIVVGGKQHRQDRYHDQNATTQSLVEIPQHKIRTKVNEETVYNKNVHVFKSIFNSNDKSQLPFMASLRRHRKNNQPPQKTVSEAFEVAAKSTCNQFARKQVSDFKCASRRLATSYYRWHNQTGRNSLWATEFECSLRKYNENPEDRRFYSYVKPIVYQDTESRFYDPKDMVCDRHARSFSLM